MASPSMSWRYLIVILLLGIPRSRILSSATYDSLLGGSQTLPEKGEQLIDEIVQQLSQQQREEAAVRDRQLLAEEHARQQNQGSGGQSASRVQNGVLTFSDPIAKKEGKGLNLDVNEPKTEATTGQNADGNVKEDAKKQHQKQSGTEVHALPGHAEALRHDKEDEDESSSRLLSRNDTTFAVFVAVGVAAGFIGLMMAGICYYKFRKNAKAASDVEYPAYGVTGPMKEKIPSPGDRKLAQSAQMYHYQHQKQQMIAMEKANGDMKHDASDDDSEEDNVEGDYTVYECPGLAPTGEMEVINPLFRGGQDAASATKTSQAAPSDQQGEQQ